MFESLKKYFAQRRIEREEAAYRDGFEKGGQCGCNWTLGGLFQRHQLEVVTDDGVRHPHFDLATKGQTAVHLLDQVMVREVA